MKSRILVLFASLMLGSLPAFAVTYKNFSDISIDRTLTVTGATVSINGVQSLYPSTAPSGQSILVFDASAGSSTYRTVVTDPARKSGINVFTASNTFNNLPIMLEQISSPITPPEDYLGFYAKDGSFYKIDESGEESEVGGGGWVKVDDVTSSSGPVVIGRETTDVPSNQKLKIANGFVNLWDYFGGSTTVSNVTDYTIGNVLSWTLTELSTFTAADVRIDLTSATFVPPLAATNPGFTLYEMWLRPDYSLHFGTAPLNAPIYSSSGSVVLIDARPNTEGRGRISIARFETSITMVATQTVSNVLSHMFVDLSTFTLTDATESKTIRTITGSTSTAVISTQQDNYPLSGNYTIYLASAAVAADLTGFANTHDSREVCIMNVSTNTLTIKHESASSTEANRFIGIAGADYSLPGGDSVTLWYHNSIQRWRPKK